MKLSAWSVMGVFGDLAAIAQGADGTADLIGPRVRSSARAGFCRRRGAMAQLTTAAAKRGWSEAGRPLGAPGRRAESIIWRGRERPAPGPARAHGHERRAPRSPPLGERQAESGRIGLLAFPWNQETLQPTRHETEQQGRLVADHLDRMRHTAGKSRVGAGSHLDTGIADPRDELPLHHVEQLVLARVGVQRRLLSGPQRPHDCAIFASGLAALHFHLDARASARGHRLASVGRRANRLLVRALVAYSCWTLVRHRSGGDRLPLTTYRVAWNF